MNPPLSCINHHFDGRALIIAQYDAFSGLRISCIVVIPVSLSANVIWPAGRVTNVVDRLGNPTVTAYDTLATSVHRPNGVTAVTERYLDGQTKRVLENGVVKQSYTYGITPDGTRWTLSADGSLPAIAPLADFTDLQPLTSGLDIPWQLQAADTLGRSVATYTPGFGGTVLVNSNAYDIANNLLCSAQYASSPNPVNPVILSKKLYSYAANGSLYLSALDLNTNGLIDVVGVDRITGSSSAYEKDAANTWWKVSRSWVYPEFNSSAAVTTSVNRVLLTGLGVQQGDDGVLASYSEARDVRGNATVSKAFVDRTVRKVTQVTSLPTSIQPTVQTSVNGLLWQTVSSTAVTNSFGYDLLGRRIAATDGRGNTTITAYNTLGQVVYTEDAATNRSSYAYDPLGRRVDVTDALGNVTHARYDTDNRVVARWGATYPVAYEYDIHGRMVQMGTYRNTTEITDYASFLSLVSSFDKTSWLYEQPTGLLTNKLYADGLGSAYTYTADGRLAARLWARGILTSYGYDMEGSLLSVDYSDFTPDIAYTYDRLGNMASVTDASGIRTFTNDTEGQTLTDTVQLQNAVFTLHEAYDTFGRSAGYALSNTIDSASSLITGMAQGYDAFSRISEVSVAGLADSFCYGWLTGSDLQMSLVMPNGVTRQTVYDPHRDLLVSVTHTNVAGVLLTRRTFSYDVAGRMTDRTQYRVGDETNRIDAFGYNARLELTQVALGTNAYAYAFDPIGNRQTATEPKFATSYSANGLNQYTNLQSTAYSLQPSYDVDGNQTLIRTTTGIWHIVYNAENRPVLFSNDTAVIKMAYDYHGRRFEYKETVNGTLTRHEFYRYRGFLRIAAFSLMNPSTNAVMSSYALLHTMAWDPAEPVATRPLCLQIATNNLQATACFYSLDQAKNVTELFGINGQIIATYDYAPFGTVIGSSGDDVAGMNPLTFSSEVTDFNLGLIYYNYRHLNVLDGRWIERDPIKEKAAYKIINNFHRSMVKQIINNNIGLIHMYLFCNNDAIFKTDRLGLIGETSGFSCSGGKVSSAYCNSVLCKCIPNCQTAVILGRCGVTGCLSACWYYCAQEFNENPEWFDLNACKSECQLRSFGCIASQCKMKF